ncbi:MAG: hypothetical protein KJ732_05925 [Candidatus Margulisbacteria bacterium]|nr:hypothetical protein [Candidatus Margulisiibacteriota bacterium]
MPEAIAIRQYQAVRRVMSALRRDNRLRSLITRGSELNLRRQAINYPSQTRAFLKNLLRLESLAIPINKIVVPKSLPEIQNREVFKRLGEMGFVFRLIDKDGVLDLRRAGLKLKPGYRDLTLEFEEYGVLEELRSSFHGENREVIQNDLELSNLTLYYDLWMVRVLLYRAGEQKSAALKEENPTAFHESRSIVATIAKFLREMSTDFPTPIVEFRQRISKAADLLADFNNPAANAALVSLTARLEEEIEAQEEKRVRQERHSGIPAPQNLIEEELVRLAQRRYKISFSEDGIWVIPQGGFRQIGPVMQKKIIDHQVESEKVIRRAQHILDSITEQISINGNFRAMLEGFAQILRSPEAREIDYPQLISGLAQSFLNYENGIVRPKFKVRLMLKLALELVNTASKARDQQSENRLLKFAGMMLSISSRELVRLNTNLGHQLRLIAAKQELQMTIIAQNLVRDTDLRTLSESLLNSLTNRKIMNSARLAGDLRQLAVEARDSLEVDEQTEVGIQRCKGRIENLISLLAKVRRLIHEKERSRTDIEKARERHRIEYRRLAAGGQREGVTPLRNLAIEYAQEKLRDIRHINEELNFSVANAAKEALLIQRDLANKHAAEDVDTQVQFLAEHQEVFEHIARMDIDYSMTYGTRGEELGEAHSFDIWKLDLKTRPGA